MQPNFSPGDNAVCLTEINAAREAAGFAGFAAATNGKGRWPKPEGNDGIEAAWLPLVKLCYHVFSSYAFLPLHKDDQSDNGAREIEESFQSGTYASMALNSEKADCAAAVDHWGAAFMNFTSLPPPKTPQEKLYENQQNVSFVAMYSPSSDAVADCRVVTCTQTAAPSTESEIMSRSSGDPKTGYALLCMTTPEAFKNEQDAPFTYFVICIAQMARLTSLFVVKATVLLLATAGASSSSGSAPPVDPETEETITYTVKLGEETVCLSQINAAREPAGLAGFITTQTTDLWPSTETKKEAWRPVCRAVLPEIPKKTEAEKESEEAFSGGTYAFLALSSSEPDCAAIVDHWKEAFSNFTSIPPPKSKGNEEYENSGSISFVALYNPSQNATADCRVVTCTQMTPSDADVDRASETQAEAKERHAVLCMTTPDAFGDGTSAPFTEMQWSKIAASLTNSSSAVTPALVAFVAAALGCAAF
ncbi:SAG family member [Eimeria brunetti]|uniref:SAG family member n=1 Tax=Eimeria brunetti TaxID=51314 RepID=U6L5I4_9EIME|nr:SAG family member [Eimeria brunetti]